MRYPRISTRLAAWLQTTAETRPGLWMLSVIALPAAVLALAVLYVIYRLVDPLPPHRFEFAAGIAGSGFDNVARRYAQIMARDGVELKIRNTAGAVENLELLRNAGSGLQAALSTLSLAQASDAGALNSLGGVFDAVIFIFYKGPEPITQLAQFRGKRLSIGTPGTSLRQLILQMLEAGDATDISTRFVDLDYGAEIDALIAGDIDRAGLTFWQQYTSYWLTSLLDRFVFFVIPIIAALIPVIGFAPRLYHWLGTRRINRLHRALGKVERELARGGDKATLAEHHALVAEIEALVRSLKVVRPFEVDLHRLRVHLSLVQDQLARRAPIN